jgi:hypothetical protein
MPLLDTFTAAPEALAFLFPGHGALAAHAPRVHGGVAQALAAALRGRAGAGRLFAVGEAARRAQALPLVRGLNPTSEGQGGSPAIPPLCGHLVQRLQARRYQDQIGFMARRPGARRSDRVMGVAARDAFGPLVGRVAGGATPRAPLCATVVVPAPWSTLRASCCSAARCRTRAPNACQSDPASAPGAKPWSRGG